VMYGNHSAPDFPIDPHSPSRGFQEDFLMPRYWDARGHAKGILAPGGTIQRVSPDLKTMWDYDGGYRNAYDFSIDTSGELFTFDSDMEWDIGLPWYRAVRVVHCIAGADYGWRSGSSNMPNYYVDTLPPLDDVGRGSPVGTCFYDHTVYPEKYRGGFYMGDWSRGRIRAIFPKRDGGTFKGKTVDFLVGEPLNVTDMDVAPDGLMYFAVGGRGTQGGLYRIKYGDAVAKQEPLKTIEDVVKQPMRRSAWGRYALDQAKQSLGRDWESGLVAFARNNEVPAEQRTAALEALQAHGPKPSRTLLTKLSKDESADVRAFAVYLLGTYPLAQVKKPLTAALDDSSAYVQRRAGESLLQAGLDLDTKLGKNDPLIGKLLKLLNSDDTFVRYTARVALERTPRELWAERVLAMDPTKEHRALIEGVLALVHTQHSADDMNAVFDKIASGYAPTDEDELLAGLRVIQLAFIRDAQGTDRSAFSKTVGESLLALFPSDSPAVNRELQILLAHMEGPGTIDKLLAYQTPDKSQEEQIHTAYCLRTIQSGWTREQRDKFIAWFDHAREMDGGASFEGFIEFIWQDTLTLLPDDEKQLAAARKDAQIAKRNEEALALLTQLQNETQPGASELAQMSAQEIREYLEYDPMAYPKNDEDWARANEGGAKVFTKARCINCHVFGTIGKGGGPDLSTVASRFRRGDLIDAIMEPSKVISDQYIGLEVDLSDLTTVTGMLVTEDDKILTLIDVTGKRVDIPKSEIEERRPATRSIMPEGLLHTMNLGELVHLVNFLEHGAQ
ncbi:MAG: HEAT repeat domain-containing protein, partial [Candidatus Hydrogenedentes bacterium]|nr:HEAT repeat domain-containing protein [Candidatus Hydrogenedentota bacterium]